MKRLENIQKIFHSFELDAQFPHNQHMWSVYIIVQPCAWKIPCGIKCLRGAYCDVSQALVFLVGGSLGGTRGPTGAGL